MPDDLDNIQAALKRYRGAMEDIAKSVAVQGGSLVAQTATEKHMRDAGSGGPPFPPRGGSAGPLRILSGRLARSLTGAGGRTGGVQGIRNVSPSSVGTISPGGLGTRDFPVPGTGSTRFTDESINRLQSINGGARLIKGSRVPYAAVHEHGFTGQVNVRQHTRATKHGTQVVSTHTRSMHIPARPFLEPALEDNRERIADLAEEELGDAAEVILDA